MHRRATHLLAMVLRSLRSHGGRCTFRTVVDYLGYHYRQHREEALDRRYGTDTGGTIALAELSIDSPHVAFGVQYEPITRSFFRRMLAAVPITPSRYVFLDLGCGKGRALLLAADYPFKRIVGVDFAPELCGIARDNVERFLAHTGRPDLFEVRCQDAAFFRFSAEPLALFLYNPFAEPVLAQVLANLQASLALHPRPLLVFYRNPLCSSLLDQLPFLRLRRATPDYRVYASCAGRRAS